MGDPLTGWLVLGVVAPVLVLAATVVVLVRRGAAARTLERVLFWGFGATALWLPWSIAVATKLWLDAHGEPTYPWTSFLSPTAIAILVPVTLLVWAFPFPLLGALARWRYLRNVPDRAALQRRLAVLGLAYGAGLAAGGVVFRYVFRFFDFLYIFIPLGVFIAGPMGFVGLVAHLWLRPGREITPTRSEP